MEQYATFASFEQRKRAERLQRRRNKLAQEDNPVDLRVVLLVVAGFTCALVLLTKLALGL